MPLDRARALSAALDLDPSLISALLNGMLLPEWDVLLKICKYTERQPGYFFDDSISQYPTETRSVKPLGSGENIVVRMPPKSSKPWGNADDDWTYIQAKQSMGFGVVEGDYVVNFTPNNAPPTIERDNLYLLGVENHLEIRRCNAIQNGMASLVGINPIDKSEMARLLPIHEGSHEILPDALSRVGGHHIGIVTMTLRPAMVMRYL